MLDTQSQQECPIVFSEMCTYIGDSYSSACVCVFQIVLHAGTEECC